MADTVLPGADVNRVNHRATVTTRQILKYSANPMDMIRNIKQNDAKSEVDYWRKYHILGKGINQDC